MVNKLFIIKAIAARTNTC